jgi:hypothetical protein
MTDDDFLCAFERCSIARKDWTHEAHVRMAWLYAARASCEAEMFNRVRSGIKKLNSTFVRRQQMMCRVLPAKPKDPRGLDGYHETVTVAFVNLIASRIELGEDFASFRDRNPDLFDRKLSALLKYYSPGRLFSSEAKAEFLEPDREPLPLALVASRVTVEQA